ncbi:MAG TPA: hypothetical protein VN513_01525 [Gemmatimonadales bacterium]|nr:hypothetical protein [Gemmatimonadales bacterium]
MEIESQGKRLLRRAGIGLRIVLGFGVLTGSAALAWKGLTRPQPRPKQVIVDPDKLGPGLLTVAVAAVDLELIAPDGRRVHTASKTDTSITPAPGAEGRVDCAGFGSGKQDDSECTATITLQNPVWGDYKLRVSSPDLRGETITIGWTGSTFPRPGATSVDVTVQPHQTVEFTVIVAPEGASQKTAPVAVRP